MSAAHLQNYHAPEAHNARVKSLIRKFNIKLQKAQGERLEIVHRELDGEKLCFADKARCSDLYLQIADLDATLIDLDSLILPEGN